jgi:glyoxylase-like metal-dependent hydrolase (beta-lactamase superfamily II)
VKELAEGVWHVKCLPGLPWAVNAYVVGDVLVDAGARQSEKRILRQLEGHDVKTHALTHVHADHQGASAAVCERLGIPFWCPEADVAAAEDPDLIPGQQNNTFMGRFYWRVFHGPGRKVDRALKEGDDVAGFEVLEAPGHSPGHIVLWRESDRVLIIGDVLANMDQYTAIPGLHEPKAALSNDAARNRKSARSLARLEPELVVFGHGAPLRDPRKFVDFVEGLPAN